MRPADIAYTALGTALISVCAWITVPFTVPFTMQLFAVFLSLILLGGRNGMIAVAAYLLLGAIGVPVFSGFRGGLGVLIGMTGGYLWGMLLICAAYWIGTRCFGRNWIVEAASLAAGLLLCYLTGTIWFSVLNAESGFVASLAVCVVPFLLPDAAKLVFAVLLGRKLRSVLHL